MRFMFRSMLVALVPVFLTMGVGSAMAAETPTYLCVPETAGQTVTSGGSEGKCEAKTRKWSRPRPPSSRHSRASCRTSITSHQELRASPRSSSPASTCRSCQGLGKTNGAVNGEGNLVIGYDENIDKHEQTGSHNLILGAEQTFTGFGGMYRGLGQQKHRRLRLGYWRRRKPCKRRRELDQRRRWQHRHRRG